MPQVNGTIESAGGAAVVGETVTVRLIANEFDRNAAGFVTASETEVLSPIAVTTNAQGDWTVTLVANADITPANTTYEVSYRVDGDHFATHISVPDTAGPFWVGDILTAAPTDLAQPHGLGAHSDVGDLTGASDGQALAYDDATEKWIPTTIEGGEGGGAPTDATYLVATSDSDLSAEVVVGATPGGELGGTWASPTVDATHSGSTHASVQAAAEATASAALTAHGSDTTSVHGIADTSLLATDAEVATAVSNHSSDTTSVHGIADTSVLATSTDVATAVSNHSSDTSSVHGIADTTALETTSGAQTKVDTHVNDASAAHAASAVSFSATGTIAGTDVQTAVAEVATDAASALSTHESDTTTHGATGAVVGTTNTQTLSGKTLTTPTIGDFTNATHDHADNAGGGTLDAANIVATPSGELVGDTVAEQLVELDGRVSATAWIDDRQTAVELADEFFGENVTSGQIGALGWAASVANSGVVATGIFSLGHQRRVTTSTSSASAACCLHLGNTFAGAPTFTAEWIASVPALSTVSEEFIGRIGLFNGGTSEPTIGFYFEYDRLTSANWRTVTADTTRTKNTSSIAVTTSEVRLRITSDGTNVRFYVDGVQTASTHTANLPDAGADFWAPAAQIVKSAGTGDRAIALDAFRGRFEL